MSSPDLTRQQAWRRRNPEAYRAHIEVQRALRKGELNKPNGCEQCGRHARLDGHHPDAKGAPLKVQWLCRSCHMILHRRNRA